MTQLSKRESLYNQSLLCQMHPDLWDIKEQPPMVQLMAKAMMQREREDRRMEWWLRCAEEGLPIPDATWNSPFTMTVNATQFDEKYEIDVEATVKVFAKATKLARSLGYKVTKHYESSTFDLKFWLSKTENVQYYANRETVCVKRHIGTEVIPAQPERVEDKYDWDCQKIAFLGIPDVDE